MVTLVIGGSGSGKSSYAEQLLEQIKDVDQKYYIATMQVYDEDGKRKVERHRRMRRGKGFLTVEQLRDIGEAVVKMKPGTAAALLECVSNLTANEMFGEKMHTAEETARKILADMKRLRKRVKHLVIVTNNVFEDGTDYEDGTKNYLKALGRINRELACEADDVIEVVAGLPVVLKDRRVEG